MFLNLPHKLWNCVPIPFAASLVQLLDILSRLCFFTLAIVSQHMHGGGGIGRTHTHLWDCCVAHWFAESYNSNSILDQQTHVRMVPNIVVIRNLFEQSCWCRGGKFNDTVGVVEYRWPRQGDGNHGLRVTMGVNQPLAGPRNQGQG